MKILIVSDTHGRHSNLEKVLELVKPIDMLIHLGDTEGGEDYIEVISECEVEVVAGNNDFYSDLPMDKIIYVGNYKIFLTHGHYLHVYSGLNRLREEAVYRGADIVMYGHTHVPMIEEEDDLIVLNPGSLSYPRQEGRRPSYILMEVDEEGEAQFFLNYL